MAEETTTEKKPPVPCQLGLFPDCVQRKAKYGLKTAPEVCNTCIQVGQYEESVKVRELLDTSIYKVIAAQQLAELKKLRELLEPKNADRIPESHL